MADLERENLPMQLHWYDAAACADYSLQVLTQNAEAGTPTGIALMGRYDSDPVTYDDGDAATLALDSSGRILLSSDLSVDYSYVDNSAFTVNCCHVAAIGAIYESSVSCVGAGCVGIPRMTIDRHLVVDVGSISTSSCLPICGTIFVCQDTGTNLHTVIDCQPLGVCQSAGCNLHTVVDSGCITIWQGTCFAAVTTCCALKVDGSAVYQPVSRNTCINAECNPLYVQVVEGTTSGTEIHQYGTCTIAKNVSCATACYLITSGKTFLLTAVEGSSSVPGKFTVSYGVPGTYCTYTVVFTSGATPYFKFPVYPPLEVVGDGTNAVEITARNDGTGSYNFYGTIDGNEI